MIIDYFVGFSLDGVSGKRKATNEKARKLKKQSTEFNLYSLNPRLERLFGVYISLILSEISYVIKFFLKKKKPDILYVRSLFGFIISLIAKFESTKIIFEVHSDFRDESKILYKNRFYQVLSAFINSIFISSLRKADGVIFNNPDLERYFINEYNLNRAKTISIYNGSNTVDFYPEEKSITRSRLNLNYKENDYVLVFTGSVSKWHGVHHLIEVFEYLVTEFKKNNFFLYIVGGTESEYRNKLIDKYHHLDSLIFIENVPTEIARDYINAADICMLPVSEIRVSQGSPLKLYDYIACGKPIVTQSNVMGYSDVVDRNNLGISVNFYNPESAARVINDFYANADLQKISSENELKAKNELNWSNVIKGWIKFAQKI